ncbi:hypothetical protein K443DRAFT_13035 [Laccaria amethystina LaAM-08-1]|uniref:Uncharacterized protein n=1 Tax=Laccaria amethystina LaAM-08-1 TaxID=1095629 RepID=A0A0C9WIM8_9AGAR|nr:hypothetical protein K443DRAFT_13035 [Laccaria amethystina LaAM-08-1]
MVYQIPLSDLRLTWGRFVSFRREHQAEVVYDERDGERTSDLSEVLLTRSQQFSDITVAPKSTPHTSLFPNHLDLGVGYARLGATPQGNVFTHRPEGFVNTGWSSSGGGFWLFYQQLSSSSILHSGYSSPSSSSFDAFAFLRSFRELHIIMQRVFTPLD